MASSATLTTTHLPTLRKILDEWDQKRPAPTGFPVPLVKIQQALPSNNASKDVIVAFRTRPPLPNEAADKFRAHADAIDASADDGPADFCAGITVTSTEPGVFVAHVPGMKWSGPTLTHKKYEADLAFGPSIDNEEVYQRTVVANDMLSLALSGGVCCILAYGQTGSGKTYTMESVEHRMARDLFDQARTVGKRLLLAQEGAAASASPGDIFEFSVTFLELLGRRTSNLLESTEEVNAQNNPVRTEVLIHEDKIGNIQSSLISSSVRSSGELEELINFALSHRRTSATLRNAASSRSHALLTITIRNTLLPYADEGQLILVDLAGSERYEDSKEHDKQRMEEALDNNKSLMNLKECVRAKAKMAAEDGFVHIPWRANKLTMLFKMTNTLAYTAPFKTAPPKPRGPAPYDANDPRTWYHDKTVEWLTVQFTEHAVKRLQLSEEPLPLSEAHQLDLGVDISKICPPGSTAKNLGMLYTMQFTQHCLEARSGALPPDALKHAAVSVIGALFYLIITAKTRTHNEIMKSRRKVVLEDAYENTRATCKYVLEHRSLPELVVPESMEGSPKSYYS
ncbi:P-loop containing nucleoside triphosphate hydrolase protein [Mycena rosella]|uniref:Kinesin-like protein n=1 Tax=Mycena rosella TaxID=1033263 RepID=A0AAD7MBJ3_MYCRO|nr:P-loop containing nucleoside triphosphate hydrolase protein [Mycena rosella]